MRVELMTPSLPRKCSTPELLPLIIVNRHPEPVRYRIKIIRGAVRVGRAGFEPTKSSDNRFTVCPSWPLWYLPVFTEHAWLDIHTRHTMSR